MANKSVLELAVSTGQWDAGLKKAKDALNNFTQAQGGLQSALKSDSDKMQQFVQMIGKMDSTAKTAKGQMNDYKGTIEQLTMQYNRMTDAQKKTIGQDYLQAIDQMKQKYQAVNKEIEEMNRQLKATSEITPSVSGGGGGLFGGDMMKGMLQVAGGNLITMAGSWAASLVGDVKDAIVESAELAKQAEGVQIAFARLGRGDILDGLREATHGTVTDLELMKAAVKFNDFKLPLDELGTMLAFAQQKAKDTGQSVDYMVDSIVTGLGRKSLMILDNLGLSAAEIRDKMKETGDMTKAVGEIIREQMAKAGDYVETAADRVAKANVELNNQMLELGNTMQDVLGFSGWDELATKIKTEVVGAIQFTIETIGEAKNAWNSFMQTIGVKDKPKKDNRPTRMPDGTYWETTDAQGNVTASGRWLNGKRVQTGAGDVIVTGHTPDKSNTRTTHTPKVKTIDTSKIAFTGGEGYKWEQPQIEHQSLNDLIGEDNLRAYLGMPKGEMTRDWGKELGGVFTDYVTDLDKDKREEKKVDVMEKLSKAMNGFSNIKNGIEGMGIKLPEEIEKGLSIIQGLLSVIQGVQTVISIFSTTSENANTIAVTANTVALGALTTALAANTATNLIPGLARGGIAKAANGFVDGNTFSGDQIPIMVNAGELILNRAQQGAIASQLEGGGMRGMQLSAVITGEQLRLVLNNNGRRTGRGEYVTTNFR